MSRPPMTSYAKRQFQLIQNQHELREPGSSAMFVEAFADAVDQIGHSPGFQKPRHTASDILKMKVRSATAGQYHVMFTDDAPYTVFYLMHVRADEVAHMTAFDVERYLD